MQTDSSLGDSPVSFTADDRYLWQEGTHTRLYEKFGAHYNITRDGTSFAVWAPHAATVSVIGDFNGWQIGSHPLRSLDATGIWSGFVPGVRPGERYKYAIRSQVAGYQVAKADPFGMLQEAPPHTASRVWDLDYTWGDQAWMTTRQPHNALNAPLAIYEVHLGSWRRNDTRFLTYRELAEQLPEYVQQMGFTHVELMPVMEHPFYGSWGYQITGYYSPTARYGTPQEFMLLIDALHAKGIGVILDWVPAHFPRDEHGLGYFDGTHLYEDADPRRGVHPDWQTFIFDFTRPQVQSFLLSNANFWLDRYHIDALRVDAVTSLLLLDFSRKAGEWLPNIHGGRENLEAITFIKHLNERIYAAFPATQMIAEESAAWPLVTRPTDAGGLGFGLKWDLGWMHDTLDYFAVDPHQRSSHQHALTFRPMYATSENFILPLSHDEVVYGKRSLLAKMPGDPWQQFANLRLLFGYMYGLPGKKLLFMGGEFAQQNEWNHDASLDWALLAQPTHQQMQHWVQALNHCYQSQPALFEQEHDPAGFAWIDCADTAHSILIFQRRGRADDVMMVVACNFSSIPQHGYRVGVPATASNRWQEILNSDDAHYGGSGLGNPGALVAASQPMHGHPQSLSLTLPPLAVIFLTVA